MVEPNSYADVVAWLDANSKRPRKATLLWTRMFAFLPRYDNEMIATREQLGRLCGCTPRAVSEVMTELESIGAIYRRPDGNRVRYFVNPKLGTHLRGDIRARAQAEAPKLMLVPSAA